MKKVHDNVHKRYSDKTMLTIKTNLLKIEQAPVNKGTFIGTGGTLGQNIGITISEVVVQFFCWEAVTYEDNA